MQKIHKSETRRTKETIILQAKSYLNERQDIFNSFSNNFSFFGIEIEHALLKQETLLPALGDGTAIVQELGDPHIAEEYGSFQIEQISSKYKVERGEFLEVLDELAMQKSRIWRRAKKMGLCLFSGGVVPYFPARIAQQDFMSTEYHKDKKFYDKFCRPLVLLAKNNHKVTLSSFHERWSIINALHIHYQPRTSRELVDTFNFSQMVIPLMIALGANAGYLNGELWEKDVRLELICNKKAHFFDSETGLLPMYITSPNDFFDHLFLMKSFPVPSVKCCKNFSCVHQLSKNNAFFVQLRISESKKNPLRIEFKPLSTQPTIEENVALAMFYILLMRYLYDTNTPLMEIKIVEHDIHRAIKHGLLARLHFFIGGGWEELPCYQLAETLLRQVKGYALHDALISENEAKLLDILIFRCIHQKSPSDMLSDLIVRHGHKQGLHEYVRMCSQIPKAGSA